MNKTTLVLPSFLFAFAAVFAVAAMAQPAPQKAAKPDPALAAGKKTAAMIEAAGKWQSIFDGKTLQGWTGGTDKYIAEDGILRCTEGARHLYTEKDYGDFVLGFEFKLTPGGNSGIGIRVPVDGQSAQDGMEIQILDHDHEKYAGLKPWQAHGSIYAIVPAKTGYLKPPGEWNQQFILCIEDHVMVILNGAVIVDSWLDKLTAVDGDDRPGLRRRSGRIAIAGHNDPIEFRNLEVMDFTSSPPKPVSGQDNAPPPGFAALFNGKDLSGWKGLAHKNALDRRAMQGAELKQAQAAADESMREHWSVVDGTLTYDGKGQSLCTAKDYGDFEMYVDWKIPPGADSGLYLRGTPQVQIWDPWDPRTRDGAIPETPEAWVESYRNGRNLGSGALWNNKRHRNSPLVLADNKPGEWNTFFIRMVGDKATIYLNGKLIVDRVVLENFWDKDNPDDPVAREDQIELQHHGSELYFKNLYIREIPY